MSKSTHLIALVTALAAASIDPEFQKTATAAIVALQDEDTKIEAQLTDHETRIAALEADSEALDQAAEEPEPAPAADLAPDPAPAADPAPDADPAPAQDQTQQEPAPAGQVVTG